MWGVLSQMEVGLAASEVRSVGCGQPHWPMTYPPHGGQVCPAHCPGGASETDWRHRAPTPLRRSTSGTPGGGPGSPGRRSSSPFVPLSVPDAVGAPTAPVRRDARCVPATADRYRRRPPPGGSGTRRSPTGTASRTGHSGTAYRWQMVGCRLRTGQCGPAPDAVCGGTASVPSGHHPAPVASRYRLGAAVPHRYARAGVSPVDRYGGIRIHLPQQNRHTGAYQPHRRQRDETPVMNLTER